MRNAHVTLGGTRRIDDADGYELRTTASGYTPADGMVRLRPPPPGYVGVVTVSPPIDRDPRCRVFGADGNGQRFRSR